MYQDLPIQDIYAREILDSRGNPTVEVEILAGEKSWEEQRFHPAHQRENLKQ